MKHFLKNNISITSASLLTLSTVLYFLFQYCENRKVENKSQNIYKFNVEELRKLIKEFFIENATFYC